MKTKSFTLIAFLGLAVNAFSAMLTFTLLPGNTENGTYNGFSSGTLDGVPFSNLICDDYDRTTYFPSGLLTYNLSTLTSLVNVRFGATHADAVHKYEEAAILVDGLVSHPSLTADYQYALWTLFTPTVANYHTSGALLASVNSISDFSSYSALFSRVVVYTPAAGFESNQEFFQIQAAPEPGSLVLLGIGMALIGARFIRRRSNRPS